MLRKWPKISKVVFAWEPFWDPKLSKKRKICSPKKHWKFNSWKNVFLRQICVFWWGTHRHLRRFTIILGPPWHHFSMFFLTSVLGWIFYHFQTKTQQLTLFKSRYGSNCPTFPNELSLGLKINLVKYNMRYELSIDQVMNTKSLICFHNFNDDVMDSGYVISSSR